MGAPPDYQLPQHPLDVKPSGNAFTASHEAISAFSCFPDEIIVHILEFLDPVSLSNVGAVCKHLRAFARFDELWKTLCITFPPETLVWRGSWFSTFTGRDLAAVSCEGVFSDTLYRPFLCAHTPLEPYASDIPQKNRIQKLCNLSADEFLGSWTDKPFILTEPVKQWPIFSSWSEDVLSKIYGDTAFRAECVDWSMSVYVDYMNSTHDESPLYLFDRAFVEKMSLAVDGKSESKDYWPPQCFGDDYFNVLGEQRPDFRWLIIGPERSGSTFHKDPNGTSAWNAVITGSKYWIMFPSGPSYPPPPGVFASADQSEVTTPASIAEWLLGFHAEARELPGCIEGVCNAGEILHVPSGWWHLVVNLEPSIALTQNFVPKAHLHRVIAFLRDQKNAISGFRENVEDPYALFVERLEQEFPHDLEDAQSLLQRGKKRAWEVLVQESESVDASERKGFSFGFGNGDSDEEIP